MAIVARRAKKPDGVMAILASAGVKYTHENAEVIGTSKVETRISSRAAKAGGAGIGVELIDNCLDHMLALDIVQDAESRVKMC